MAFAAYLLKNAILVLSRGVAFAHFFQSHHGAFAACPPKNDNYLTKLTPRGRDRLAGN